MHTPRRYAVPTFCIPQTHTDECNYPVSSPQAATALHFAGQRKLSSSELATCSSAEVVAELRAANPQHGMRRRIQDAGAGVQTQDMNFRFLPCVAAGLAYYIAMKQPELVNRLQMLKSVYDEQFNLAAGEDHEKATMRLVPRQAFIGGGAI